MDQYVFISSSSNDLSLVMDIAGLLEKEGISVWIDRRELKPGADWEREINNALRNSAVVLSIATEKFISSEWFHSQANLAIGLGKPLIPVVAGDLDFSRLPNWATKLQIVRYPEGASDLVAAVLIILGRTPTTEAADNKLEVDQTAPKKGTRAPAKRSRMTEHANQPAQERRPLAEPPTGEDKTPFHKDTPASADYLGRQGFVEALAQWINRNWDEYKDADKSFVINIHGQWGAGKTTFLNLLQNELRKPSGTETQNQSGAQNEPQKTAAGQWIVVWFNAWENRHIKPEWWPLLDRIYRESVSQKARTEWVWHIRLREWWWRFYSGRKLELLGLLVSSLFLVFIVYWGMRSSPASDQTDQDFMQKIAAVAQPIGLVLSALTTIFLGTKLVSQTLISSDSAQSAQTYLQFTPDPIENIKQHFNKLIDERIKRPVIVFIDDLDRCDRAYLVSLLETIQTLLNHQKVFYVIAADQRWLFAAFEETYKDFRESIKEPGKKIGYLFLEKIFQLSMSIPSISDEARKVYLDFLLGHKQEIGEKREQMKREIAGIENEQALIEKVKSQEAGTIDKVIMREVAVAKSASLEIEKETVHFLSKFAHLMEPNPRAIKRLVTFYGVLRAIALLSDEEIISDSAKRNQLALWTIVRMRWPLLADYLEEYPEHLDHFRAGRSNKTIHPDVIELVKDGQVRDVLNGKGINCELTREVLERFTTLKATEKTF